MVIRACGGTSTEEGGVRRAGGGADDTCARAQPHTCPSDGMVFVLAFARRTAQAQAQAQRGSGHTTPGPGALCLATCFFSQNGSTSQLFTGTLSFFFTPITVTNTTIQIRVEQST